MIIPEDKKGLLKQLFNVLVEQNPGVFERSPEALTWMVHHPAVDVETKLSAYYQKRSWRITIVINLVFHPKGQESDAKIGLRTYLHRLDPQNSPQKHLLAHEHEIHGVAATLQLCLQRSQELQVSLMDPKWVMGQLLKDGEPFSDPMVFVSSSPRHPYRRAFALCLLLPIDEGMQTQHNIKQLFLKRFGNDPDTQEWWQTTTERWHLMENSGDQDRSEEVL